MAQFLTRVAAALALLLLATPAQAADGRWIRVESPNFVFYSDASENEVRRAAEHLETFDQLLRSLMQVEAEPSPAKLDIYLFRNRQGLERVWPGMREGVRGFYAPDMEHVAAYAIFDDVGFLDAEDVLFHEYAHHFMFQYLTGAYPAWFVEGFAEYVQTAEIRDDDVVVGNFSEARVSVFNAAGRWLTIPEMLSNDYRGMSDMEIARFYAQAWLMVHYVNNSSERWAGLRRYIRATQSGADALAAFEPSFGISPTDFGRELRDYARGRIGRVAWRRPEGAAPALTVTRLPAAADALMQLELRMRRPVDASEKDALIADVRAAAARYPGDEYATRALAEAALLADDEAGARALLEPLIAANASDAEALYWMGRAYLREATDAEVEQRAAIALQGRRFFARAYRLNPNHPPTLYFYVRSFGYDRGPLPPAALDVLTQAYLLAPEVSGYAYDLAIRLMLAERYDEAAVVLAPLAFSPHESNMTPQIRGLLEDARAHRRPTPAGASAPPAE